jgi:hypothetical protein
VDTGAQTITLYLRLISEGTDVVRPTQAVALIDGTFRLLPTADYDAENEIWEFPPASIVGAEVQHRSSGEILVAVPPQPARADMAAIHDAVETLNRNRRSEFLLNLANELTIAARSAYSRGCDEVESPEDLRRYNEILHRVLANLRDIINGSNEDVWSWGLVAEESRRLPPVVSACRRALEFTNKEH